MKESVMDSCGVLIVDDDGHTAGNLRDFLRGKEGISQVEWASSVMEALEYLKTNDVGVVVLDLIMSINDGYQFLELMDRAGLAKKPQVIVVSAISHEDAVKKAMRMGVRYYMLKPYENSLVYERIMDVIKGEPDDPLPDPHAHSLDKHIMEMFLVLGLPPHLKGYQYLREAVKLVLGDASIIYSITKRLYPQVAEKFDVTATKVELAIRHTLEVAWQRNKMDNMKSVFGCDIYLKNNKPTNGEFIALVADKLSSGY